MSRILLANEFGSGLGHVNRLIAVAKRLNASHSLIFALPKEDSLAAVVNRVFGQSVTLKFGAQWAAPHDPKARTVATHTLADVMRLFRFDDNFVLQQAADRWQALIDEIKPDLIIADFAPTLRLVVGSKIPIIVVGNGYTIPPSSRMLPPIRPWQSVVPSESLTGEIILLKTINKVAAASGHSQTKFVADLFSGLHSFVSTLPEFDPYRPHRTVPVKWPFNIPNIKPGPSVSERSGPTMFVYLPASHPFIMNVIESINDLGHSAHLYITGADPREIARRCKRHVGVLVKPADFSDVLPRTRLLVHHAGLGTAYAGLAAGTPQLLLPLSLEHLITSRGLAAEGLAMGFTKPPPSKPTLSGAIQTLLNEPIWMERTALRAATLATLKDPDPLAEIISVCNQLLGSVDKVCQPEA